MKPVRILQLSISLVWFGMVGSAGCSRQAGPALKTKEAAVRPKVPEIDDYFGTKIADEYRWLEKGADPEVRRWSADQNKRARAALDSMPMRSEIEARLTRLL